MKDNLIFPETKVNMFNCHVLSDREEQFKDYDHVRQILTAETEHVRHYQKRCQIISC